MRRLALAAAFGLVASLFYWMFIASLIKSPVQTKYDAPTPISPALFDGSSYCRSAGLVELEINSLHMRECESDAECGEVGTCTRAVVASAHIGEAIVKLAQLDRLRREGACAVDCDRLLHTPHLRCQQGYCVDTLRIPSR